MINKRYRIYYAISREKVKMIRNRYNRVFFVHFYAEKVVCDNKH